MFPSMVRTSGDLFADFARLQEGLDAFFGAADPSSSSIRAVGRADAFPLLNIGTSAEALEVYAFAPGIDPASVEVTVERGLLTLAGERQPLPAEPPQGASVYARERFSGRFRRVVSLPEDADPARVDATYRDGVLKVVVGKLESAKARRIPIQSGDGPR